MLLCFCGYSIQWDGCRREFATHFTDIKVWMITPITKEYKYRQNSDPHSSMVCFQVLLKSSSAESVMSSRKKNLITDISA